MRPDPVTHPSPSVAPTASHSVAPAPSPSTPPYDPQVEYEKNLASAKSFKGLPCHGLATWVVPGRRAADEVTVFESLGLAIEDLAAAHAVYRSAQTSGAGVELPM